jgi:hypothetical protein
MQLLEFAVHGNTYMYGKRAAGVVLPGCWPSKQPGVQKMLCWWGRVGLAPLTWDRDVLAVRSCIHDAYCLATAFAGQFLRQGMSCCYQRTQHQHQHGHCRVLPCPHPAVPAVLSSIQLQCCVYVHGIT